MSMKDFEEVYKSVMDNEAQEFIKKRKKSNIISCMIYPLIIILFVLIIKNASPIIINIYIIVLIVYGMLAASIAMKLARKYKKVIINKFLKGINESFDIYPEKGIEASSYTQSGFKIGNKYSATDLIVGKLENDLLIQMSDINVRETITHEDGTKTEALLFKGLFLRVDFKNKIDKPIKLLRNEKRLMKKNLKIDNSEFEKVYDIYAENELQAFQLYTADVMEKLLKFKKKTKLCPEIVIKDSNLYIRIAAEQLFEPTIKDFDFNKKRLELYYEIIKLAHDMSNHMLNTIIEEIL